MEIKQIRTSELLTKFNLQSTNSLNISTSTSIISISQMKHQNTRKYIRKARLALLWLTPSTENKKTNLKEIEMIKMHIENRLRLLGSVARFPCTKSVQYNTTSGHQMIELQKFLNRPLSISAKSFIKIFRPYQIRLKRIINSFNRWFNTSKKRKRLGKSGYRSQEECETAKIFQFYGKYDNSYTKIASAFRHDLELYTSLLNFYKDNELNCLNRKGIWLSIKDLHRVDISFNRFKHLSKICGLSYINKRIAFDNSDDVKESRIRFINTLLSIENDSSEAIFFFDTTSFSEGSFKKKVWSITCRPNRYRPKFTYNLTHLLFMCDIEGNVFALFVKGNLSSIVFCEYFKQCYSNYRATQPNKKLTIVLDNATMHKTRIIKSLAIDNGIKFIFIPPKNPFMNVAEYAFRFIKSDLRKFVTCN